MLNTNNEALDRQRIEELASKLMEVISSHYQNNMAARQMVLEALNALAWTTAAVVSATGPDGIAETTQFFQTAFNQNIGTMTELH